MAPFWLSKSINPRPKFDPKSYQKHHRIGIDFLSQVAVMLTHFRPSSSAVVPPRPLFYCVGWGRGFTWPLFGATLSHGAMGYSPSGLDVRSLCSHFATMFGAKLVLCWAISTGWAGRWGCAQRKQFKKQLIKFRRLRGHRGGGIQRIPYPNHSVSFHFLS